MNSSESDRTHTELRMKHKEEASRNKCLTRNKDATRSKCRASSNRCLTSSNKKLVETRQCYNITYDAVLAHKTGGIGAEVRLFGSFSTGEFKQILCPEQHSSKARA